MHISGVSSATCIPSIGDSGEAFHKPANSKQRISHGDIAGTKSKISSILNSQECWGFVKPVLCKSDGKVGSRDPRSMAFNSYEAGFGFLKLP